ncbi:MAG TPA: CPBP family glutamic-type intramembrane protease, partial [Herpetosiphonaceae bacterium]
LVPAQPPAAALLPPLRPVAAFPLAAAPLARQTGAPDRLLLSAQSLAALPLPAGIDEAWHAAERMAPLAERILPTIAARAEAATLAVAAELVSLAAERIAAVIAAEWPLAAPLDRKAAATAAAPLEEIAPVAAADLALDIEPAVIAPLGEAEAPVASAAASANLLNFLGELPMTPEALAGPSTLAAPLARAPLAGALASAATAAAQPATITLPQPLPLPAASGMSVWLLWGYLGLITLGELLTAAVAPGLISPIASVQIGLALHAAVLIGLVAQGSLSNSEEERKLCLGLTLAPLIRLLSLSLPLTTVPQITWYPLVSIPLLMATWLIARQLRLPPRELGLRRGNLRAQLMLIGIGFGLGVLEFVILKPKPIMADFSAQSVALTAIVLTIFTGFTEELIFRGLLQRLATPVLKRTAGLFYVALLFGVLHIGYQSVMDVVFVFLVGLLFAYLVDWSKSILGVTLAHGLTNVNLFLIMPLFSSRLGDPTAPITWIVGIGTLVSMAGMWIVYRQAQEPQADGSGGLLLPNLRLVREARRLSRGDLARQAGLSVRSLAELERGRLAGSPE